MGVRAQAVWGAILCLGTLFVSVVPASAELQLESTAVTLRHPDGTVAHLAGTHPDFRFSLTFPNASPDPGRFEPAEALHDLVLDLPPGMVADPTVAPACPVEDFASSTGPVACRLESQIGTIKVQRSNGQVPYSPLFNLEHGPEVPARFGFIYFGLPIFIVPRFRAGDYAVSVEARSFSQATSIAGAEILLWGVPADPAHDAERGAEFLPPDTPNPSGAAPEPLLRNPTSCGVGPTSFFAKADSWEHRGAFDVAELAAEADGTGFAFEGCASVPFNPTLSVTAGSRRADSPTGLALDVGLPQDASPSGQSPSDLRETVIALPHGMTVSDSAVAGLGACAPAQIGLGRDDAPACPADSRVGTVKFRTPVLGEEAEGGIYLARQRDNPFGSTLALYLAAKVPGTYLKLAAKVGADPETGQLTITLADLPQLPIERLRVELDGGPRALLKTPRDCGTYAVGGRFVPWSGTAAVAERSSFAISEGCLGDAFSPGLRAGTATSRAGAGSTFVLQVTRRDGEQNLAGVDLTLPRGLFVKPGGVPLCAGAAADIADCPAASRIGRATIGVGTGPTPLFVPAPGAAPAPVYLAGPYRGAPYSILASVPVQAGPFDLGHIALRFAIHVDPRTAQASIRSDSLPQILEGIPIAYRDLRVELDRPGFVRNPTSCGAKRIEATIHGAAGANASPVAGFQATDCARLGFDPALALGFSGSTHRSAHPALSVLLKGRRGDANVARATITLPRSEYLDNTHIRDVCEREEYAAGACPEGSIYGWASARSPLLAGPLRGPVYLRSSGHDLPDLAAALDGPIRLDLVGRIDSVRSRIRLSLRGLPDVPLSRFALNLNGGKGGLLVNNTELCGPRPRARVDLVGQNGKGAVSKPPVKIGCGDGAPSKTGQRGTAGPRALPYTRGQMWGNPGR